MTDNTVIFICPPEYAQPLTILLDLLEGEMVAPEDYQWLTEEIERALSDDNESPSVAFCPTCGTAIGIEQTSASEGA